MGDICCKQSSVHVSDVVKETESIDRSQKSAKLLETPDNEKEQKRRPWWGQLFGRPLKTSKDPTVNKETTKAQSDSKSKKAFWAFGKKRNRVSPVQGDIEEPKDNTKKSKFPCWLFCTDKTQVKVQEGHQRTPHKDLAIEVKTPQEEKNNQQEEGGKEIQTVKFQFTEVPPSMTTINVFLVQQGPSKKRIRPQTPRKDVATKVKPHQEKKENKKEQAGKGCQPIKTRVKDGLNTMTTKLLRHDQIKNLGFPNPANNCYMNSCLQSLLMLKDFVSTISRQEQVWSSVPQAALLRWFNEIKNSHFSPSKEQKLQLLTAFKNAVSLHNPEFNDYLQKDAHEFLTSVLDQIRSSGPILHTMATSMDGSYECPVDSHMTFKMQSIRICGSCNTGSERQEDFTNLSLDLVPGCGTVDELLNRYLKVAELEYGCDCGHVCSTQKYSFATLPKVLILHLKRFIYTPQYQLVKVSDPVHINRDLVVTTSSEGGCYSLVSIISHLGSSAVRGHYICEGVDPKVDKQDKEDRWFMYSDALVTQTSGPLVCKERQGSAFILFYERQD